MIGTPIILQFGDSTELHQTCFWPEGVGLPYITWSKHEKTCKPYIERCTIQARDSNQHLSCFMKDLQIQLPAQKCQVFQLILLHFSPSATSFHQACIKQTIKDAHVHIRAHMPERKHTPTAPHADSRENQGIIEYIWTVSIRREFNIVNIARGIDSAGILLPPTSCVISVWSPSVERSFYRWTTELVNGTRVPQLTHKHVSTLDAGKHTHAWMNSRMVVFGQIRE